MFGIEVAFYALGFLTCLILIAIIEEVNDKEKKNKRELKRKYRKMLREQKIISNQEETEIDIAI